jgi:hypothetical protein
VGPDACENVVAYAIGQVARGDTSDSGSLYQGSCSLNADAPEVVHSFIAAANGPVCFTTSGSSFNTLLYIRSENCTQGEEPEGGCNINNAVGQPGNRPAHLNVANQSDSTLHFEAQAGVRYYIFVDGWHLQSGAYVLSSRAGWCDRDNPPPVP